MLSAHSKSVTVLNLQLLRIRGVRPDWQGPSRSDAAYFTQEPEPEPGDVTKVTTVTALAVACLQHMLDEWKWGCNCMLSICLFVCRLSLSELYSTSNPQATAMQQAC